MAKLSFTKLGLKANQNIKTIEYNGQIIEVKQYLPVNDKLGLISDVINSAADGNFANPIKVDVYAAIYIIEAYTNLIFTDKQKEDICKIYDLINGNGLLEEIVSTIPEEEYGTLWSGIKRSINALYDYKNSVLGILEQVSADYSALDYEATDIQKKIADPKNMELLRGVLSKLG
jgi:hypothetical protein